VLETEKSVSLVPRRNLHKAALEIKRDRIRAPIPYRQSNGPTANRECGIDQRSADPVTSRAGIYPEPFELVRGLKPVQDCNSDTRTIDLRQEDRSAGVRASGMRDLLSVARGKSVPCGGFAEVSFLLTLRLDQVRLHESTDGSGIRPTQVGGSHLQRLT